MMTAGTRGVLDDIRRLARPLRTDGDLDALVHRASTRRVVAIGEATHGTHEFYDWRARLTRRLVEEHGFGWIGVEGDWPDCWRIDRWVRGIADQGLDARGLLAGFERWPTWMWANEEVASFLDGLRDWNAGRPESRRVGFYGLDVYSLWDSLERTITWLEANAPEALPDALRAWQCFAPFGEDPQRYAWSTRLVPESCETEVVDLLVEVRRRSAGEDDDAFDAAQNAAVVADAERYYRTMVRTDRGSWNVRDVHMVDTVDRLTRRFGPAAKGVVWAHNTHVGDARATSMAAAGLLNVGQLLRQRYGEDAVLLVGLSGHRGEVLAAERWGAAEERMPVPPAPAGSHDALLHEAIGAPAVLDFGADRRGPWLSALAGQRAIGVVHEPGSARAGLVPTVMGRRYDALLWFEETSPTRPLHHEAPPIEPELETAPSGM